MGAPLPVDRVLPDLVAALSRHGAAVLHAPTGAGKTTRVPPHLLDAGMAGNQRIVLLEPRRIAARAAATRMAEECGSKLGDLVGYQVRFERNWGDRTRILVLTEGLLVRMLQADPFLSDVGCVLLDEFHERSLATDLSLAMLKRVREARPDLRLCVMSATLDVEAVAAYVGGGVVRCEGRQYPIDVRYRPGMGVSDAVRELLAHTGGSVLVFVPGAREIREVTDALDRVDAEVRGLHGDFALSEQAALLRPSATRRVVVATNVAETSLTLPGITGVVDTGRARVLRTDPFTGLDRLVTEWISRASADQRAGRAGREAPGVCIRLWSDREHAGRPVHTDPEIRRVDLSGPLLDLLCWGERDPRSFPWYEAPADAAIDASSRLLEELGATRGGAVTPLGKRMVRLPVHPRLARMMLDAHERGQGRAAAGLAALLSGRDPLRTRGEAARTRSDALERLEALTGFERGRGGRTAPGLDAERVRPILKLRDALWELLREEPRAPRPDESPEEALLRSIFAGYRDRTATNRSVGESAAASASGGGRGRLLGGRGVRLDPSCGVRSPLFVCMDVDDAAEGPRSEALVRMASEVREEWLPKDEVVTEISLGFDPETERVTATSRRRWRDLTLWEGTAALPEAAEVASVLCRAAEKAPRAVLPTDPALETLLARVEFLAEAAPELGITPVDDDALRSILPELAHGCRSFADLRTAPGWQDALMRRLPRAGRQALDREAPTHFTLPSGRRAAIVYESGRRPVLAVRMQELFGVRQTPRIALGRVPLLLHLLAPNGRPQQITDDLAGFWERTWPEIRKELRARYPKHAWPERPHP